MADEKSSLVIQLKDGEKVRLILPGQKPVLRFTHGIMQVDYMDNGGQTYMAYGRDEVESLVINKYIPADVNGDGAVDVADISTVISVMADGSTDVSSVSADVNGDGAIDVADISAIITEMAAMAKINRDVR